LDRLEFAKMASREEVKAGFDAASQDAKMHVEVLRREVKADLDAAMHETKAEISELRRKLPTVWSASKPSFTSFHSWARTYESKARGLSTLIVTFEERLSMAEDRLNRLERARPIRFRGPALPHEHRQMST